MNRYIVLSSWQLLLGAILVGVISAALGAVNTRRMDQQLLPEVLVDKAGACVRVVNYDNGHAFTCTDVDVILRRYRKATGT